MTIGCQIGAVSSKSDENSLKVHYDTSVNTNLFSDVGKTTNPVLDGGSPTGVIKVFKNLAYDMRDSIQTGITDVLYQTSSTIKAAYFNVNSHHEISDSLDLKDLRNTTTIFVLKSTAGRILSNKKTISGNVLLAHVSNNLILQLINNSNITLELTNRSAIPSNTMAIYACKIDVANNIMKLWNNLYENKKTITGTISPGKGEIVVLGGSNYTPSYGYNGFLYEFKLYNKALSDIEIRGHISDLATKWNINLPMNIENSYTSNSTNDTNFTRLNDGIIATFTTQGDVWAIFNPPSPKIIIYTYLSNVTSITFHITSNPPYDVELPTSILLNGETASYTDTIETSGNRQMVARQVDTTSLLNYGANDFIFTIPPAKTLYMSEFVINTS